MACEMNVSGVIFFPLAPKKQRSKKKKKNKNNNNNNNNKLNNSNAWSQVICVRLDHLQMI